MFDECERVLRLGGEMNRSVVDNGDLDSEHDTSDRLDLLGVAGAELASTQGSRGLVSSDGLVREAE